jgi:flagellar hook-associated protein 2
MKITVTGDADVASLLAYDPAGTQNLSQSVAAQNALLTVNGLAVSSASNKVTDAVDGATLNLLKTGTSNVTVSRDIASARSAVEGFVKAYNDLNTTLRNVSSSDAKTGSRAVLNGDPVVRNIQLQLRGAITGSLGEGLNLRTLSDVGIAFDTAGVLKVDSAKLNTALEAGPEDVSALFASSARPSDSLVSVKAQTSATKAGTYDLNVSTLATRGALVGSAAAATTITAGVNDSLTLDIDGTSAAVQLSAGSYTAATLATMVQAAINGTSAFSSKSIGLTVEQTGGILTLWSNRFGSASTVSVSGIGAADLLGGSPTATAGVDVAGSIGGASGTGSGRVLTGASGSDVAGLQLEVQGETTGARGTVTVGTGFGAMINQLIDGYLGSGGVLAGRTTGLNDSIKEVGEQREVMNRRLGDIEKRYRAQFTSLDTMMSRMLQTSSYLTQQLSALQANT